MHTPRWWCRLFHHDILPRERLSGYVDYLCSRCYRLLPDWEVNARIDR
jgi:hypothetical protein